MIRTVEHKILSASRILNNRYYFLPIHQRQQREHLYAPFSFLPNLYSGGIFHYFSQKILDRKTLWQDQAHKKGELLGISEEM